MAFGNAGRSLKLYLQGDTSDLEKALSRAEYKLKRFNTGAGGAATKRLGGGGLLGLAGGKGGIAAAGAGAAAFALKSSLDAARDSQVVLGQTQVALEDAGLSWAAYGKQVQDVSTRISQQSAFDDEAVMQSFSVFVRGQKDVGRSLQLAALAADVARGRYVDLDSATQLVNKAAMGQIGALRRAGIQIDKNATSTEALAALQAAYGGAAERYGKSSAGAQDRLRVSLENLQETVGSGALPVLTNFSNMLATSADNAGRLASALAGINFPGIGSASAAGISGKDLVKAGIAASPGGSIAYGSQALFFRLFGDDKSGAYTDNSRASGAHLRPDYSAAAATAGRRAIPADLRNQWFDANMGRRIDRAQDLSPVAQANALKGVRSDVWQQIKKTKDATRKLKLEDLAVQLTRDINGIWADQAQAAKDARDEARRKSDEAKRKQREALQKAAQAATSFASGLKDSALAILDNRQNKMSWQRDLTDAKEQLRFAKLVGDPYGIRDANRSLQDAQLQRQRWQIENANVKPVSASSAQIVMNGVTVVANNPQQLIDAIAKAAKRNTGQVRGRLAPTTLIH